MFHLHSKFHISNVFRIPDTGWGQELASAPIFVWYDYFCVPQLATQPDAARSSRSVSQNPFEDMRSAILSIPIYIAKCVFFVALCPVLKHLDTSSTLNQYSWSRRGWCRCEKMVRELAQHESLILMIEGPKQITLLPSWGAKLGARLFQT